MRLKTIAAEVAARRGVDLDDILGTTRKRPVVLARWEVWANMIKHGWTVPEIARDFNKHHTTVYHGLEVRKYYERDS